MVRRFAPPLFSLFIGTLAACAHTPRGNICQPVYHTGETMADDLSTTTSSELASAVPYESTELDPTVLEQFIITITDPVVRTPPEFPANFADGTTTYELMDRIDGQGSIDLSKNLFQSAQTTSAAEACVARFALDLLRDYKLRHHIMDLTAIKYSCSGYQENVGLSCVTVNLDLTIFVYRPTSQSALLIDED